MNREQRESNEHLARSIQAERVEGLKKLDNALVTLTGFIIVALLGLGLVGLLLILMLVALVGAA